MNDPHVEKMFYIVENDDWIDYGNAEGVHLEEEGFRLLVEDKMVCFEMKEHYPTVEAAKEIIDRFVAEWELDTDLKEGPDRFRLRFHSSEVVDRNPLLLPPGTVVGSGTPLTASFSFEASVGAVTVTKAPPKPFPWPRQGLNLAANDRDVIVMNHHYAYYMRGRASLPVMAYFCLTMLEFRASGKPKRKKAACEYSIDVEVLDKVGCLTANKGGPETARKAEGIDTELTSQDSLFLKEAVKAMIRRVAEVAANPNGSFKQITQADLPPC